MGSIKRKIWILKFIILVITLNLTNSSINAQQLYPANFDLTTLDGGNGFRIPGILNGSLTGSEVDFIGDINNDGLDDIAIGAQFASFNGFTRAGTVYVVFGSSTGFDADFDILSLNGTNGFIIEGIEDEERIGSSISGIGDVNGDGIDDFITAGDIDALVIYGSSSTFVASIDKNDLNGSNGFIIESNRFNEVAGLGDVNGDGISDFIVGPVFTSTDTLVIFGRTSNFPGSFDQSWIDGSNGFRIDGYSSTLRASYLVGSAGDVNNDGFNDIILGDWSIGSGSFQERTHVLFGRSSFDPIVDVDGTLDGSNGFTIQHTGGSFLAYVGLLGDINNDNIDDIFSEGLAIYGSSDAFPANFDVSDINGSNGFNLPAISVAASIGDINRDGIDDFVSTFGGNGSNPIAYVVFGSSTGFPDPIDETTLNGNNGFIIEGLSGGSGRPVDGGGDFNGDGISDFILGNRRATNGEAYVVFGGDHYAIPLNTGYPQAIDETLSGFTLVVNGPETGTIHYAVYPGNFSGTPDHDDILNGTGATTNDNFLMDLANTDIEEIISSLMSDAVYDVYLFLEDGVGNQGEIYHIDNVRTLSPTPSVNLSVSSDTGTEAAGTVITVTATSSAAVAGAQTIDLATTGTGITAADFTLSGTTITIADGMTTGTVTFTIEDDAVVEGTETATLTISNPSSGIMLGTTTTQDVVITDNDIPSVNLSVSSDTGTEAAGTVITVTATSSSAVVGDQTIDLATTGTGITATDFTLSGTRITIADGMTTGTVTFTIVDDTDVEGTETATLTISNPSSGIMLGTTTTQDVVITDNDIPSVNLSVSSDTGTEAAGTVITVTATSSSAVVGDQTIDLATTGTGITATDFTLSGTTITIADGMTTGTVTFTIVDDTDVEGTETATLTISTPSSGITLGTITTQDVVITDNDLAICTIEAGEDQEIVEGQEIQLNAMVSNPGTLIWSPSRGLSNTNITDPIANPTETTTYTLLFTGTDGCTAEDMVTVFVTPLEEDQTRYGFSPDDDGINEYWEINGIDNYPNNKVLIYNRWGDLVFEVDGYNNTSRVFRGIANRKRSLGGDKLPEGTYFFDIKIEGAHNLKKETGFLVLKR
ncbi:gliding motility-associated C-terminal domain-containing protein [Aquimarina sp. AU119]|uniref:T9SS type B sorting domain-containing protein n=1 Tax=Aquimarina sp. AU119 TaxID=2108528 RepID=UPI000D690AB3|nr:gliding motility-associated C-terminal domain-containing protein [Aquimarina sp. AU119]